MGRYEKIKAHTNVAISWIIQTARAHGNDVCASNDAQAQEDTSTTAGTPKPKSGRLKGKARKEAKQNAQKLAETATYKVSTEEILRQCQYLQKLGLTIPMSRNVWFAFREAVRGRQRYAEKFAQEQPEHEGNAGHVYFLDLLRRVTEMLSGIIQVEKISSSQRETHEKSFKLSNLFEALSIDEVDKPIEDLPPEGPAPEDSAPETSNKPPMTRYEPAIDASEELSLRWYCFRDDVLSITEWVAEMWASYTKANSNKDLWLVGLLSDLAVEMILKLEEELHEKVKTEEEFTRGMDSLFGDWTIPRLAMRAFEKNKRKDVALADHCRILDEATS